MNISIFDHEITLTLGELRITQPRPALFAESRGDAEYQADIDYKIESITLDGFAVSFDDFVFYTGRLMADIDQKISDLIIDQIMGAD